VPERKLLIFPISASGLNFNPQNTQCIPVVKICAFLEPKLSDFLLDLRRSLAHKGFAKILDISTGMPAVFANLYASRSQHISSQKIAQLRLNLKKFSSFRSGTK